MKKNELCNPTGKEVIISSEKPIKGTGSQKKQNFVFFFLKIWPKTDITWSGLTYTCFKGNPG